MIHAQDLDYAFRSIPKGGTETAKMAALDQVGLCDACLFAFVKILAFDLERDAPEMSQESWLVVGILTGIAAGRKAERERA